MAEDVHARLGIGRVRGKHGEHDTGGPEHDGDGAGLDDADAEGSGRLVARTGDLGRLVRRRQPLERDLERRADLLRPAAPADVEEQRPGGVGDVDRVLPGQPEADVVLREQDPPDPAVGLRFVAGEPQQLRRGEPGQRPVPGQLDQALEADAALDLGALGGGSLVVPEDRRPQNPVALAERDEPVHLAAEADRPFRQPGEHRLRGPPPVLGILLGPAGLRGRERVALLGRRDAARPRPRARCP